MVFKIRYTKTIIIIAIFSFLFYHAFIKTPQLSLIEVTVYEKPYLSEWDLFRLALISVESEFNPLAENPSSKARGILQITPIFVAEANRLQSEQVFVWKDAWDVKKSLKMLDIINPERNVDLAIKRHNPTARFWYKKRVYQRMEEIGRIFKMRNKLWNSSK